ncbi:uncharacterized protein LOC113280366 [Papaver somniferum]|uniref:uncharacterized protein LOC113280366 n=1 Tax=Papaver somniferum TaxID=3469 RepID=UPI000E70477E|nr:uncharacterized protein LOC113280366 [Papaver somniferum]
MTKLKKLKLILKKWNWETFGDVNAKLLKADNDVMQTTLASDRNPADVKLLNDLVTARGVQEIIINQHKAILFQKSRTKWLKEDKFKFQEVQTSDNIMKAVPEVLSHGDIVFIYLIPSANEIKVLVYDLDPDSAPGPDGFGGWQIDPSNFFLKIITNIPTMRISSLLSKIISPQQGAFIKGKTIQEQIVLASEVVNEMEINRRGGNIGMKIDITQAFDSLSWEFLFTVMQKLGFSIKCINWIKVLFRSSSLDISQLKVV